MAEIFEKKLEKHIFLTLDHMGTPLRNQNFENRASSCFKLAKIKPRARTSLLKDCQGPNSDLFCVGGSRQ